MNAIIPKTLTLCLIALLAGSLLWSCGQQPPPSPPKSSPSPTAPTETAVSQATAPVTATLQPTGALPPTVPTAASPAPIVVLIADQVTTLEPYRMVSIHPDGSVASLLWDTLTRLNDNLQLEPAAAESWRLVNNFTWEFKLRPGISFHNGEPLNAEAVRFSIERSQSMPGSLETFAQDVQLKQVEVVDDGTVRFTTNQPIANLPYHLAFLEILPPQYYTQTDPNRLAAEPLGSGPYRLNPASQAGKLILDAVPDYWQGAPALPQIIFETVPQVESHLAALREGRAALVTDLPPMPAGQWQISGSRLESIEGSRRMFIGLRIEKDSPLADKRVRQALNYAVNVKKIVDERLAGYGERYGSWVNPPANNPELAPWPYNPDQARDLLAKAGYGQGFTATLRLPSGFYHQDEAVAKDIAQQLAEVGVLVTVEPVDWSTYTRQLLTGDVPPLFLLGLNSRGDGLEDVKNLTRAFAFNPTGWQNDSFEDVVSRAEGTINENSRARLLNEAQAIAYDEAPWIWLWRAYNFYGVSQTLDWTPRRDGLVYLYQPAAAGGN